MNKEENLYELYRTRYIAEQNEVKMPESLFESISQQMQDYPTTNSSNHTSSTRSKIVTLIAIACVLLISIYLLSGNDTAHVNQPQHRPPLIVDVEPYPDPDENGGNGGQEEIDGEESVIVSGEDGDVTADDDPPEESGRFQLIIKREEE